MIRFAPAVVCAGLAACSTSYIAPDIKSFGSTVEEIAKRDARTPSAKSLDARVAAARRADFAASNVQYMASDRDACEYNRPDLDTEPFADACQLVPKILVGDDLVTAASEYDPEPVKAQAGVIVQAGNTALLQEYLAEQIRGDLVAYSKELSTLASTKDPTELGTAASKAFDSVAGLKDATSAAASKTGKPAPASSIRKPARTLVATLATEIAEMQRYRTMQSVVRSADPFVSAASLQLAALTYRIESPGLETQAGALREAMLSLDAGSEIGLNEIEEAYKALAEADEKAAFRGYSEIGATHRAILKALEAPGNLESLSDANKRIQKLAEAFKDFAEEL